MAPKSVAFLGASNTLGKMGTSQLLNILYCGFPARVHRLLVEEGRFEDLE